MTIDELLRLFSDQQAWQVLQSELRPKCRLELSGVVGSSFSLIVAEILRQQGGVHIFVMEDKDAAGYLYNDLYPLVEENRLLFFPTGYKRSIQYGQEDASGLVQRTKALSALQQHDGNETLALCTYPEALVEKVVGQKTLTDSVLRLRVGERFATSFVEEVLAANRFERVDFVYEPGQYSIRGGIIDIFSYSSNVPYRVDFFGDEIASIRPFDISTQLSTGKLEEVEIVPNLKDSAAGQRVSFAEFAGPVTYWMADGAYTLKRFDEIRTKLLGDTEHPEEVGQRVTSRKEFLKDSEQSAFVLLKDNIDECPTEKSIAFTTAPQPQFNKKFELLAEDIQTHREQGYETYFLTENKAQIERLGNIFNSIGEKHVRFGSIPITLHAGFIDHATRKCFYTDHQIFDRYQRYRIRGELDRSESLTIQELNSLKVGDYVVHIDHGVGRFGGLVRTVENGKVHEAIKLIYRQRRVVGQRTCVAPHLEIQGQGQRASQNLQVGIGGMAADEAQYEEGGQGHCPRADRSLCQTEGKSGICLFAGQLSAARVGGVVHL